MAFIPARQIIVRQVSGLGNQMFQYAAGLYYAKRYGAALRIATDIESRAHSSGYPRPFLLSQFAISAPHRELTFMERLLISTNPRLHVPSGALRRSLGIQVIRETAGERFHFLPDLPLGRNARSIYLAGYWQVHQVADAVADDLRAEFTLRKAPEGRNSEILKSIEVCPESVSVHIRRGDYTLASEGNVALTMNYYAAGLRLFRQKLKKPLFFVFSDDTGFVRENFPRNVEMVLVDHNDPASAHEDLRLMSACRHHLIANSTFSWWAAWLNPRPDKIVVAPDRWKVGRCESYPDLLPPTWVRIND